MEACGICLATDVKMHSIHNGELKGYIQAITRHCKHWTLENRPKFICYICAVHLIKCCKFIEKALSTQETLMDILKCHGKVTKALICNTANKTKAQPLSTLEIHKITRFNIHEYRYDKKTRTSYQVYTKGLIKESDLKTELETPLEETPLEVTPLEETPLEETSLKQELIEVDEYNAEDNDMFISNVRTTDSDFDSEDEKALVPCLTKLLNGENSENLMVFESEKLSKAKLKKTRKKCEHKKKGVKMKCKKETIQRKDPTDLEKLMKDQFNIVTLTLEEQIAEWKEINRCRSEGKKFTCEVCTKSYSQQSAYQTHMAGHDPSRGPSSCPVCKLRYKSDVLVRSHVKFSHTNKYHCNACNKTLNTLCMAKRHQKWHSGQVYGCLQCPFSTQHEALLSKHVRIRHPVKFACSICGNGFTSQAGVRLHTAKSHGDTDFSVESLSSSEVYKCEECDLSFTSEGARRVHLLTSFQHKRSRNINDPSPEDPIARRTCKSCGQLFATLPELTAHVRVEHPKSKPKQGVEGYPIQCEHCEAMVHSRKEHWIHVRQTHPKERASYRPVITAVCQTCGKGFQNTTKLQLHELRHSSPTVRCEFCDKLFYDKFRLNDHLSIHREAFPHRCRTCGRGFKAQANLNRHYKTHTDIASYECTLCGKMFKYSTSLNLHVRSVHYKIPPPPRKKRTRVKNAPVTGVTVNSLCNIVT